MHKVNKKPERFRQAWKAYADPFNLEEAKRETSVYGTYGVQKTVA
jgi:hypothetical protein